MRSYDWQTAFVAITILAEQGKKNKFRLFEQVEKARGLSRGLYPALYAVSSNKLPAWQYGAEWVLAICVKVGWLKKNSGTWEVPQDKVATIKSLNFETFRSHLLAHVRIERRASKRKRRSLSKRMSIAQPVGPKLEPQDTPWRPTQVSAQDVLKAKITYANGRTFELEGSSDEIGKMLKLLMEGNR